MSRLERGGRRAKDLCYNLGMSDAEEQLQAYTEAIQYQQEAASEGVPGFEPDLAVKVDGNTGLVVEAKPFPSQSVYAQQIGERIRTRRVRLKMSQADVAAQMGVSGALVGQWELGKSRLAVGDLFHISKVLKTTQAYLVGESSTPAIRQPTELENTPEGLMNRAINGLTADMDYTELSKLFFEAAKLVGAGREAAKLAGTGQEAARPVGRGRQEDYYRKTK